MVEIYINFIVIAVNLYLHEVAGFPSGYALLNKI